MHHQRWRRQSDRQLMPHGNTDSKKGASLQLKKVLPTQNPTASKILFKNKGEIKIISMRGNYESLSPGDLPQKNGWRKFSKQKANYKEEE